MPIVTGSRYSDSPVIQVVVNRQTRTVITPGAQQPQHISYYWYILTEADTLSSLAVSNYSDPSQWWRIADSNPEVLDWLLASPGILIRIPVIV